MQVRKKFALFILSALLAVSLTSCDNFFTSGDSIATITVSPGSFVAATGQSISLTASGTTVNGDTKDVTATAKWSSSNASVATVSAGTVTTVGAGTATITVSQDDGSATINVLVGPSTLSSSLTVATTTGSTTISAGSTVQLTATDSGTTLTNFANWSSSNTSVATVSSTGLVTGITGGGQTTTITANVPIYTNGSQTTATGSITITVD